MVAGPTTSSWPPKWAIPLLTLAKATGRRKWLLFTIKLTDGTVQVEGRTHESALMKHLMSRRRSLLSAGDPARAYGLFAALPRKAVVIGGGTSKSYKITWEKVGEKTFPGARYAFSVEESGLRRLLAALSRR